MECDKLFKDIIKNYDKQLFECKTIDLKLKFIFNNVITLTELIEMIKRDYYRSIQKTSKNLKRFNQNLQLANQLFNYQTESSLISRKCLHYYKKALLDCNDDLMKAQIYLSMAKLFMKIKDKKKNYRLAAIQSINHAIEILENCLYNDLDVKQLLVECRQYYNDVCPHRIDESIKRQQRCYHIEFPYDFDDNCSIYYDNYKGRYLKTLPNVNENIPYGTHIIRERFISIILDSNNFKRYCFKCYKLLSDVIYPCRNCCKIVFCSKKCEQQTKNHECQSIPLLQSNHYAWHLFNLIKLIGGYENFLKWIKNKGKNNQAMENEPKSCEPYYNNDFINELNRLRYHKHDEQLEKGGSNNSNDSFDENDDDEMKNFNWKILSLIDSFCLPDYDNDKWNSLMNSFVTTTTTTTNNDVVDDRFDSLLLTMLWALKIIIMVSINITNNNEMCKISSSSSSSITMENNNHVISSTTTTNYNNEMKWPNKFNVAADDDNINQSNINCCYIDDFIDAVNNGYNLMRKFSFNLFGWSINDDDDDNVFVTSLNNNDGKNSKKINQSSIEQQQQQGKIIGNCLYLWTAMINHSCVPNAYWNIDDAGYITITTLSEIKPDIEINISYGVYDHWNLNERRRYLLKRYHFYCKCNRCTEQESISFDDFKRNLYQVEFGGKCLQCKQQQQQIDENLILNFTHYDQESILLKFYLYEYLNNDHLIDLIETVLFIDHHCNNLNNAKIVLLTAASYLINNITDHSDCKCNRLKLSYQLIVERLYDHYLHKLDLQQQIQLFVLMVRLSMIWFECRFPKIEHYNGLRCKISKFYHQLSIRTLIDRSSIDEEFLKIIQSLIN